MNICFLSDAKAEHTRRWTTFFAERGHSVHLVTWNPDILPGYAPVQVHHLAKRQRFLGRLATALEFRASLRRIIREEHIEVLHAHTCCSYAWMAMATGFHPYVVTPWGTDLLEEVGKSRMTGCLTGHALRRADLVTCDAEHILRRLENVGVAPDRLSLVMFGVNMRRFRPDPVVRLETRKHWHLDNSIVVLSTRTHSPIHDVETFLASIPTIAAACPEARFVVAGDGVDRPRLEAMAQTSGFADRVIFPGYLSENEMAAWLRAADIYVSTSLADAGLASSTAEAMAVGLPVVTSDFGDNGLWVADQMGGVLVPVRRPDRVARAILSLAASATTRERYGAYNRQQIEERYNYDREMEKMEQLYSRLLATTARCDAGSPSMP